MKRRRIILTELPTPPRKVKPRPVPKKQRDLSDLASASLASDECLHTQGVPAWMYNTNMDEDVHTPLGGWYLGLRDERVSVVLCRDDDCGVYDVLTYDTSDGSSDHPFQTRDSATRHLKETVRELIKVGYRVMDKWKAA